MRAVVREVRVAHFAHAGTLLREMRIPAMLIPGHPSWVANCATGLTKESA